MSAASSPLSFRTSRSRWSSLEESIYLSATEAELEGSGDEKDEKVSSIPGYLHCGQECHCPGVEKG